MLAFIILTLINIMILLQTGKTDGKKWTVYGTMGCGWTRKQLEYMKKNGKSHVFVDCDTGDCGEKDAFPTLVDENGKETVGYTEL